MSSNRGSVGALVRNSLFNIKLRFDSSLSPLSLSTSRKFRLSTLKQNSAENDSDRKKRNRKPTKDDDVHITNSEHSNSVQTDPNSIQNDFVVKGLKSFEVDHECHFIVFGAPVALQRHRSTKSGHMYNPSKKMQDLFSVACSSVLPSKPLEGPLEAKLIFYFARPKSHFGSGKKSAVLKPNTSVWHTSKKDVDNLVKFVLDSLNSKAYVDDSQIAVLKTAKLYAEDQHPRVEVNLKPLGELQGSFQF